MSERGYSFLSSFLFNVFHRENHRRVFREAEPFYAGCNVISHHPLFRVFVVMQDFPAKLGGRDSSFESVFEFDNCAC